jgi:hypothetical protein
MDYQVKVEEDSFYSFPKYFLDLLSIPPKQFLQILSQVQVNRSFDNNLRLNSFYFLGFISNSTII